MHISTDCHVAKAGQVFVVGVTADLDLDRIAAGRRSFDPTGHYSRPDVLQLTISPSGAQDA